MVWATFVSVVLKDAELLPFFSVSVPAEYVACSLQLFGINATGGGGVGGGEGFEGWGGAAQWFSGPCWPQ